MDRKMMINVVMVFLFVLNVCSGEGLSGFGARLQTCTNAIPNLQQINQGQIKLVATIELIEKDNKQYICVDVNNPQDKAIYLTAGYYHELLGFILLVYKSQDGLWKPLKHIMYGQIRGDWFQPRSSDLLILRPSFSIRLKVPLSRFQLPDESELSEYNIRCELTNQRMEILIDMPYLRPDTVSGKESYTVLRQHQLIYGDLVPTVSNEIKVKRWVPDKVPPGFKRGIP